MSVFCRLLSAEVYFRILSNSHAQSKHVFVLTLFLHISTTYQLLRSQYNYCNGRFARLTVTKSRFASHGWRAKIDTWGDVKISKHNGLTSNKSGNKNEKKKLQICANKIFCSILSFYTWMTSKTLVTVHLQWVYALSPLWAVYIPAVHIDLF